MQSQKTYVVAVSFVEFELQFNACFGEFRLLNDITDVMRTNEAANTISRSKEGHDIRILPANLIHFKNQHANKKGRAKESFDLFKTSQRFPL